MVLRGKTIFMLGIAKFDGPFESTSFTIAKFLARENDVYYIDYPYTLKDYFRQRGDTAFEKRKDAFQSAAHSLLDTAVQRLKVLILPPLLSINFLPEGLLYRLLLGWNERIILKRIRSIIKNRNIKDFIFINSFNFHYPNVGRKTKSDLLVYHCVDPLIVEYDRRHGLISEAEIIRQSDLVICTSKQLYREKISQNEHVFFIPNAADLSHSSKALNASLEIYPELQKIKRPVVGYFGNIERRIDFELLAEVVKDNREKSFVFAGPVEDKYIPEGFRDIENVFFIGRVPYEDMPSVLKGFDVAMIPFKKDEVSATIFPLKLFEYLGAGKPVVATDFNPDLQEFTMDAVAYCKNPAEFSSALEDACNNNGPERIQQRLDIASENTWDKRLEEFSTLISSFYQKIKDK